MALASDSFSLSTVAGTLLLTSMNSAASAIATTSSAISISVLAFGSNAAGLTTTSSAIAFAPMLSAGAALASATGVVAISTMLIASAGFAVSTVTGVVVISPVTLSISNLSSASIVASLTSQSFASVATSVATAASPLYSNSTSVHFVGQSFISGSASTTLVRLSSSIISGATIFGKLSVQDALPVVTLVSSPALGIGASGKNYLFDTQTAGLRTNERSLLMNLNREVISQQGVDVYLIQNQYIHVDSIFGEDRTPLLNVAKKIVMYIKDAYGGMDGSAVYSKFGFSNQQTMDLVVSVKEWEAVFSPTVLGNPIRPMEGDIIYLPRWSKWGPTDFLKITFVDKYDANGYFPLGEHYAFVLSCEKWSYSNEHLNTGVAEIDSQEVAFTNDVSINAAFEASPEAQNVAIQTKANTVLNFDANNPFGTP